MSDKIYFGGLLVEPACVVSSSAKLTIPSILESEEQRPLSAPYTRPFMQPFLLLPFLVLVMTNSVTTSNIPCEGY